MATKVRGITIELNADSSGLEKALKDVNSEISSTSKQLKDVERLLKLDPKNTELLGQKQKLLGERVEETKTKLDALREAQKEVGKALEETGKGQEQYDALTREIVATEDQLRKAEAAAKDFNNSPLGTIKKNIEDVATNLKDVGSKLTSAGKQMTDFGNTLTTKVSAPLAAVAGLSVKTFTDWESAFTGVKKTVDATAEEYEELSNWIKDASTRMASSKEDIAGVMEVAGQLGVSGVEDLEAFTETMVMLGDTTNLSAEDAATSLARFMNIMGTSYEDSDKLGSAVVDLGNNFATTEAEIVEMATRLAAAGKISGMAETDILALAASMSSVGINAEAGGTAMTQTLTAIEKAVAGLDNGIEDIEKAEKKVTTTSRALESAQDNLKKKQIAYNEAVKKYGTSEAKKQESAQKKVKTSTDKLSKAQATAEKKQTAYNKAVEKYGESSDQAKKALVNLQEAQKKVADATNGLATAQGGLDKAMKGGTTSNASVQKALIDLEAAERKVQDKTDDLAAAQEALSAKSDGSSGKLQTFARIAGMSADEFTKAWKTEPTAALNAFITGLSQLDPETESTIKVLDDLELSGIRQSNMLKSLAASSDMMTTALGTSGDAWTENSALVDEAGKRYETTESKFTQTKEAVKNVGIEIGERLVPYVERAIGVISNLIAEWDKLSPAQQDTIIKTAAIVAIIPPLISAMGGVVQGIGAISTALSFLIANPMVALVAAVVALAVIIALKGNEIQASLKEIDDYLQGEFSRDWSKSFSGFGEVANGFLANMKSIWGAVKMTFDGIIDFIKGIFTGDWKRAWVGVAETFLGIMDSMALAFEIPMNGIITAINAVIEGINTVIRAANGMEIKNPFTGETHNANLPEIPKIPYMAKGGILEGGSAIVGEAGAELLTVSNGRAVVQPLTNNNTTNYGANNFYIQSSDPYKVAQEVSEILNNEVNRRQEAWT